MSICCVHLLFCIFPSGLLLSINRSFLPKIISHPPLLSLFLFLLPSPFAQASLPSYIQVNCNIFMYLIELFNNANFVETFAVRDSDLKTSLRWVFELQCEAEVRHADLVCEKVRRCDGRRSDMVHILLVAQECFQVRLMDMRTDQMQQVLQVATEMAFCSKRDEQVHPMFRRVFVDSKLSVRYVSVIGFVHRILEWCKNKKSALTQAILRPNSIGEPLYTMRSCAWKTACKISCILPWKTSTLVCVWYRLHSWSWWP